jgi:hypothetical protein
MKKKLTGLFVCMLLITTLLSTTGIVTAGDEENPEITDEIDDLVGTFVTMPSLLNIFKIFKIFNLESFDFMDIKSAWFYEIPGQSEYLYTAIKLKNLDFINQRTIYAMHWNFDERSYAVGVHVHSNGAIKSFFAGRTMGRWGSYEEIDGSFEIINDIVRFQIPKNLIGDPEPGDVLTQTDAWTGLRFIFEPFTILLGGEVAKDWAGYGSDYIVQY